MKAHAEKVLIVDDEPTICEILSRWLNAEGYMCTTAYNGESALELLDSENFHLAISDIMMPGISGVDLLVEAKKRFPDLAVILATAVDDRETAIMSFGMGGYGYLMKPFDKNEIVINVANALERRRLMLLSQQYERTLEVQVRERTNRIRDREEEIVLRLISASGYRDDETGAHIRRIGLSAAEIAKAFGWGTEKIEDIRLASTMHDIGKIGIPDRILLKPGKLTPDEFDIMKKHTEIGASILDGSDTLLIRMAKEIALSHHEKWDGSGYPLGLSKKEIPESGCIVAIADVYDALLSDRVYRPALSEDKALSIIALSNLII